MTAQQAIAAMAPAWEGLWGEDAEGAYLIAGRCAQCGGAALGVREICPHCLARDTMAEDRLGRTGTLYTATVIHQGAAGIEVPYRVGYVDIEDGVRIFAHIAHGAGAPALGDRVALTIGPIKADANGAPLSGPIYGKAEGAE